MERSVWDWNKEGLTWRLECQPGRPVVEVLSDWISDVQHRYPVALARWLENICELACEA